MSIPTDLNTLSDDELTDLIESARLILSRRAATALIPSQIEGLAREYRDSGGEQAVLEEAIIELPMTEIEEADTAQWTQEDPEES